jgi:hypothetical protein
MAFTGGWARVTTATPSAACESFRVDMTGTYADLSNR